MRGSRAYNEGIAAGKQNATTEFDNPYRQGTVEHDDWNNGFYYIRGDGDTVTA